MTSLHSKLYDYAESQLPRVLTQLDRDPDSPTFGCFDRNYWHYKIRDFPSSILQQGIFTLEAVRKGVFKVDFDQEVVASWSVAAVNALLKQADSRGRFNEYYPYEDSYPAMAFSLYTVCKVIHNWGESENSLSEKINWTALERIAKYHSRRVETEAANQQATGLAALAFANQLGIGSISNETVEKHAKTLFSLQDSEGWFGEYGGPDFGYLTVTIDALIDYHELTNDGRARDAIDKAVRFIADCVGTDGLLPSTVNSRNTDYVVPYGLTRWASHSSTASWLVNTLFQDLDQPFHFIRSTDDRYHTHYIFSSIIRSVSYLDEITDPVEPERVREKWLPNCGYWIYWPEHKEWNAIVAAKKGGLFRIHFKDSIPAIDNGWRLYRNGKMWTTNWWSDDSKIIIKENSVSIEDYSREGHYFESKPYKHILLRMVAWIFRGWIIPHLKEKMIFRKKTTKGPQFKRVVKIDGEKMEIADSFRTEHSFKAQRSPRQNIRHVASADSFSIEDFGRSVIHQEAVLIDSTFESKLSIVPGEIFQATGNGVKSQ